MAYLGTNDDQSSPATVCFVHIASRPDPAAASQTSEVWRWRVGYCISGRIERGTLTRRHERLIRQPADFWQYLEFARRVQRPLWLFAVNVAQALTLAGFWRLLESGEWRLTKRPKPCPAWLESRRVWPRKSSPRAGMLCTQDPPTIIQAWHRSGWQLLALDVRNYLDRTWDWLAEATCIPLSPTPDEGALADAHVLVARQRAEIVERAMTELITWHHEQELGRFGYSVAGTALAAFRHRYMTIDPKLPDDQWQRDYERLACYPGRVDAFWVGHVGAGPAPFETPQSPEADILNQPPRGPYYLLDCNSAYAAAMADTRIPVDTLERRESTIDCPIDPSEIDADCIAAVQIESWDHPYPVRGAKALYFAPGAYQTILAGPELNHAILAGAVAGVLSYVRYRCDYALRNFALRLWSESERCREENKPVARAVAKAMMARLAGKFAQKREDWQAVPQRIADTPWSRWSEIHAGTHIVEHYRSIGWDVYRLDRSRDAAHCWPAINAFVCAGAREMLRRWIEIAGPRGVLHVATDALIVTGEGYERLNAAGVVSDSRLGALKIVECSDSVTIAGQSHYQIGRTIVCAGAALAGKMLGRDRYIVEMMDRLKAILDKRGPDALHVYRSVATIPRRLPSGKPGPGGWIELFQIPGSLPADDQIRALPTMSELRAAADRLESDRAIRRALRQAQSTAVISALATRPGGQPAP